MTRIPQRSRSLLAAAASCALLACADAPNAPSAANVREESAASRASAARLSTVWTTTAGQQVASHNYSPIAAGRAYALLSVAQYAAVTAADFGGGQAQYEVRRGAVAGASAQLLSALFPENTAIFDQLVAEQGAAGKGGTHPQYVRGVAAGRAAGDMMKRWAANDGFTRPWNGVPLPTGPGLWTQAPGVAPAGFQFPTMTPYYLTSASQFRPPPPPTFGSPEFLAALAFVRATTDNRTPAQVAIANFWNQGGGTPTTVGYWMERGAGLAAAEGLDERETAHVLALVGSSILDATIGCFEAKYHYQYIRPRQADPLITLPPGLPGFPYTQPTHPSYPSGHSCLSGAAVTVLESWFPAEQPVLHAEMVEAGMSRIYGGLHYAFDVSAGQALGRATALNAIAYDREHGLVSAVQR